MSKGLRQRQLTALTVLLIAGCTPSGVVERQIESQLPKYIGPAAAYDVEIEGLQVRNNAADRVYVTGERVSPDNAPVLDRLELELLGVRYNRDESRLEQVDSAQAAVSIMGNDLATFLEAQDTILEADLALHPPDRATISIRPTLGSFSAPPGITIDAEGQFTGAGSQIRFEVDEVRAAGINLGNIAAQGISREINPLVDLGGLPVRVEIKSISVNREAVQIEVIGDPTSFQLP